MRVKHGNPEDRDRITFADLEYQPANDNSGRSWRRWVWLLVALVVGLAIWVVV